jgi:hypothetical protein
MVTDVVTGARSARALVWAAPGRFRIGKFHCECCLMGIDTCPMEGSTEEYDKILDLPLKG